MGVDWNEMCQCNKSVFLCKFSYMAGIVSIAAIIKGITMYLEPVLFCVYASLT